jgi:hypothetical protein
MRCCAQAITVREEQLLPHAPAAGEQAMLVEGEHAGEVGTVKCIDVEQRQATVALSVGEVTCSLWDVTAWSRAAQPAPRPYGDSALPASWQLEPAAGAGSVGGMASHDFWG